MASLGSNRTMKLWTCCKCKHTGISITLGDCPQCNHPRCYDCDVKSHAATDAEIDEESRKAERYTTTRVSRPPGSSEPGSSSSQQRIRLHDAGEIPSGSPRRPETFDGHVGRFTSRSHTTPAAMQLIPIAHGIEHHPIYVLRKDSDAQLASYWNDRLPRLSQDCSDAMTQLRGIDHDETRITSIHLFRVGPEEFTSRPTIIINTNQACSFNKAMELQRIISSSLPTEPTFPETLSDSLQLLFRRSQVRRSMNSSSTSLPPICQPRNRQYSRIPGTGASIGIAGSLEDTATLGCYVLVSEVPMVLTVDHLIPKDSSHPVITHISEQDRFEIMLPAIFEGIDNQLRSSDHSCHLCMELRHLGTSDTELCRIAKKIMKSNLDPRLSERVCPFYEWLTETVQTNQRYRVHPIAGRHDQSGTRCRVTGLEKTEMDWALFKVLHESSAQQEDMQQIILQQNEDCGSSHRWRELLYVNLDVNPGAVIRSLGRTSGHQVGTISTTKSGIFHKEYITEEWCVIKSPDTPLEDWIEGGIGVEGDSGALIVDDSDNGVYGMLWGRTGEGPATVTIFTPMREIFHDIQERTCAEVVMIGGQEMPRPKKAEVEDIAQDAETVPITITIEEKEQSPPLEEAMSSYDIRQSSSADTRHPHSFERYRGRDATFQSTPRSTVSTQSSSGNVDGSQWPGGHTYLRYAVAPEQEE